MPLLRRRRPFDDPAWLFQVKLDGWRALAFVDRGRCRLLSRNGHQFDGWPSLCATISARVNAETAVLDGEVLVCLNDDGKPDFRALMFRRAEPSFYAFDLLAVDGEDIRGLPLVDRRKRLRRIVPRGADRLRYLGHVVGHGVELFRMVCAHDLEGIVAKLRTGVYTNDPERTTWVKVKNPDYSQVRRRHKLFERRAANGRR